MSHLKLASGKETVMTIFLYNLQQREARQKEGFPVQAYKLNQKGFVQAAFIFPKIFGENVFFPCVKAKKM